MFGLIVAGRPVDMTPEAISETQYTFKIKPLPPFNHLVVFLQPHRRLPTGTAATVYIKIPPSNDFKLLGGVGLGKESAIFKVSGIKPVPVDTASQVDKDAMIDAENPVASVPGATLQDVIVGLSIEPVTQVETQVTTLKASAQSTTQPPLAIARASSPTGGRNTTKTLARKVMTHAFQFLSSFGSDTIPLSAFETWWNKFESDVDQDPALLDRIA